MREIESTVLPGRLCPFASSLAISLRKEMRASFDPISSCMSRAIRVRSRSRSCPRSSRSISSRCRRRNASASAPPSAVPSSVLNHHVSQKYGSTTNATLAPVLFHIPSLFAASTWKEYRPGNSGPYPITRWFIASRHFVSTPSSRHLNRTLSGALKLIPVNRSST